MDLFLRICAGFLLALLLLIVGTNLAKAQTGTAQPADVVWPMRSVAKNAYAMARTMQDSNCIFVGHIPGALPWCLAIIHKEPERCKVINDPEARNQCVEDSK